MTAFFGIKIHTVQKMIKTTDKNRLFILKIINVKVFNRVIATVGSNFIIFCKSFYCTLNIGDKTWARKNKANVKYSQHLFFVFILKINKKIIT